MAPARPSDEGTRRLAEPDFLAPFARATLSDEDLCVDFSTVTTPRDRVAVVATAPLTRDEQWTAGVPGELWVFQNGRLRATLPSPLIPSRSGRRRARV